MDKEIIKNLKTLCHFSYKTENGNCTMLSFFDENEIFEGTIRHNQNKSKIIDLLSNLNNLKYLNLRKCKIGKLPKLKSPELEFLDLSCNNLLETPTWIYELKSIKHLNLGSNQIEKIEYIKGLETLKVHKNKIKTLPKLDPNLKFLNLYLNDIPELPDIDLPLLEFISFGGTKMKELNKLPINLKWISLVANQIKKLPNYFCSMKRLEGIRLTKNKIETLPEEIGSMNIKEITLYDNSLTKIPDSFFDLKLKKLNLAKNNLNFNQIQKLKIQFNGIEFLEIDPC